MLNHRNKLRFTHLFTQHLINMAAIEPYCQRTLIRHLLDHVCSSHKRPQSLEGNSQSEISLLLGDLQKIMTGILSLLQVTPSSQRLHDIHRLTGWKPACSFSSKVPGMSSILHWPISLPVQSPPVQIGLVSRSLHKGNGCTGVSPLPPGLPHLLIFRQPPPSSTDFLQQLNLGLLLVDG